MRPARRHPRIVVVDDFYTCPEDVRALALGHDLVEHPQYHKGRRTEAQPIPADITGELERLLHRRVTGGYMCFQVCIAGDQLVYHSDQQSHAATVYLTPDAPVQSGTSLLRSKATGLRAAPTEADAMRMGTSVEALEAATYQGKLLDPTAWDEVDRVGNVFNRLVCWDARMLHAASGYFGHSTETGRLFQMFFFDAV
jgi:Family of unknown function (DUF6445)